MDEEIAVARLIRLLSAAVDAASEAACDFKSESSISGNRVIFDSVITVLGVKIQSRISHWENLMTRLSSGVRIDTSRHSQEIADKKIPKLRNDEEIICLINFSSLRSQLSFLIT